MTTCTADPAGTCSSGSGTTASAFALDSPATTLAEATGVTTYAPSLTSSQARTNERRPAGESQSYTT